MKKLNEAGHEMDIGPKSNDDGFDEFWYVPLEWKAKKRWAGVVTGHCEKSAAVTRLQYVDLYSGWAANGDDPKTLAPFELAVQRLHDVETQYIAYIAEDVDDLELVKQINLQLCPIELESTNSPTYSDLVRAEDARLDPGPDPLDSSKFIPKMADDLFGFWPEDAGVITGTSEKVAMILNIAEESTYSQEWIAGVLDAALENDGQHIIFAIIGSCIRITRDTDENSEVVYRFDKITDGRPYPY